MCESVDTRCNDTRCVCVLQCVAVRGSVLCVAACCSVLQHTSHCIMMIRGLMCERDKTMCEAT